MARTSFDIFFFRCMLLLLVSVMFIVKYVFCTSKSDVQAASAIADTGGLVADVNNVPLGDVFSFVFEPIFFSKNVCSAQHDELSAQGRVWHTLLWKKSGQTHLEAAGI